MTFQPFSISDYRKYISIVLLLFAGVVANGQETTLMAISNSKGAPATMKISELKSVFMGEKQRWKDGTKVSIVLMRTNTSIGKATCRKIYNMSADKVREFWLRLTFGGKSDGPIYCNSLEDLENTVAQTPGAIGIIDKVSSGTSVKIIVVDGKSSF